MNFKKSSIQKLQDKGYSFLRRQDTQDRCGRIKYNIKISSYFGRWRLFKSFVTPEPRDLQFAALYGENITYLLDDDTYDDRIRYRLLGEGFKIVCVISSTRTRYCTDSDTILYNDFKTHAEMNRYIKEMEKQEDVIIVL
jgi:hypothetical protein